MRLYLIAPRNPAVYGLSRENRLNRYKVFRPLSLLVLARLTPPEWQVTVVDENTIAPDYASMPSPDLVGLTAFTSQAPRAYEIADLFRQRGVPVVMGGIHATMCQEECLERVDAIVTREAEEVWARVLQDAQRGRLQRVYEGSFVDADKIPSARHDLLPTGYAFGSIQTTRGCPLNCSYCSVTSFNGQRFRRRPIAHVIEEFRSIKEKNVLIVDDNLIGTNKADMAYAKELFQAMIDAGIRKRWVAQVTVNMADDEELLRLAAQSGCFGLLIGFESLGKEGLTELNKKFNLRQGGGMQGCCRRIRRHGIVVLASFIVGLDADRKGIGRRIADEASAAGVDVLHMQLMTPLPGTRLWDTIEAQGRIAANSFPQDWAYYTLTYPVARYQHFSSAELIHEFTSGFGRFYALPRILRRATVSLLCTRKVFTTLANLVANLSYWRNLEIERKALERYAAARGREAVVAEPEVKSLPRRALGRPPAQSLEPLGASTAKADTRR